MLSTEKLTDGENCPSRSNLGSAPPGITGTLQVLTGKWKIAILWRLMKGRVRFGELRRSIPGVSQHMLTSQLRELEMDGVVSRAVYPEVPPRVEYALTEHGASLGLVLKTLAEWGEIHQRRQTDAPGPS